MKKYVIFFTPRSGSSWLAEALRRTNVLGCPWEHFNEEDIDANMRRLGIEAGDYRGYLLKLLDIAGQTGNVFGAKVTSFHFELYLKHFFSEFFTNNDTKFIYVTRGDIVAQAVSLWRAVKTGVFHSVQDAISHEVEYNANEIQSWVSHILKQEIAMYQVFNSMNIRPLRINYETMMANKLGVVTTIASGLIQSTEIERFNFDENPYKQLSDDFSQKVIDRFYIENHEFCSQIYSERPCV